jgi:pyruvate/2-oxoglutarate dehydrogenase complex dihydrolipoamide acyltransferase (E2) component
MRVISRRREKSGRCRGVSVGRVITESTVANWLKAEDDPVTEGEMIAELELASAMQEVPTPETKVFSKLLSVEGPTADGHTAIIESDAQ